MEILKEKIVSSLRKSHLTTADLLNLNGLLGMTLLLLRVLPLSRRVDFTLDPLAFLCFKLHSYINSVHN